MGIALGSRGSKIEFRCGYIGFMWLRTAIAKAYDKEFGDHYGSVKAFMRDEDWDAYQKKIDEILNSERLKNKDKSIIHHFLFISDIDGKVDYKTCGKVYDLIKDIDNGGLPNWEILKQLLKDCYSHRSNLIWN